MLVLNLNKLTLTYINNKESDDDNDEGYMHFWYVFLSTQPTGDTEAFQSHPILAMYLYAQME